MISKKISQGSISNGDDSPFFIFDEETMEKNIEAFQIAFQKEFGSNFSIGYSFKTNNSKEAISCAYKNDLIAEIVSPEEFSIARNNGFKLYQIIYNGVIPCIGEKFEVAANGGIVNCDNFEEFENLAMLAFNSKEKIKLGIRINLSFKEWKSRFGIKYGSDEYYAVLKEVNKNPYVKLAGLHLHVHGGRDLVHWEERTNTLGKIAKSVKAEYIDLGGNMYGFMDDGLKKQFSGYIPMPAEYANVIKKALTKVYGEKQIPKVIIELGTPIVANSFYMIGKIENIRKLNGKWNIVCSCSLFDCGFFYGSDKKLPFEILHKSKGVIVKDATVYGYACTENDIFTESFSGEVAVGDCIVFKNIGAYAYSQGSNFIRKKLEVI